MLKLITLLCLSIGLYAEVEYDIVLLAPEGYELVDADIWGSPECLNEAGYAWNPEISSNIPAFVYHKNFGLKIIPVPSSNDLNLNTTIHVNNLGIAVGFQRDITQWWKTALGRIFIYDTNKDEYLDQLDLIDILDVNLTDNNDVIFRKNNDEHLYRYNLNNKITSQFPQKDFYAINATGQMIGGSSYSYYSTDTNQPWFFDLNTFHPLGSLDQFNRWAVQPRALSPNGLVAGMGLNSYRENKVFIWDALSGMRELDSPDEYLHIEAINNHQQIIGSYEVFTLEGRYYRYDSHAFIICPELGFQELGTLGKDTESEAKAINNQGQVVGQSSNRDREKAFIWDAEHGMRDLTSLIPLNTGWKELSDAKAINDSGHIVGTGNYYGVDQYFLLIPRRPYL